MTAHDANAHANDAVERLDPTGRTDHLSAQHVARYAFASRYVHGRRTLDGACGTGYGSAMLADAGAVHVLGIDLAPEAIEHAITHHARANTEYRTGDVLSLNPENIGRFDAIVCLETIEHLDEPQRLLDVWRTLLVPGGVLVLSVPNDQVLRASNPFHRWRAEPAEVRAWLEARFAHVVGAIEAHAVGSLVLPSPIDQTTDVRVRTLDALTPDDAPGMVFVCTNDAASPQIQPAGVMLANGLGYVRDLNDRLDELWNESRRLIEQCAHDAKSRDEIAAAYDRLRDEAAELRERCDRLWQELEASNEDRADAHERARQYAAERDAARHEAWTHAQTIESLQNQLETLRDDHAALTARIAQAASRPMQRWLARLGLVDRFSDRP